MRIPPPISYLVKKGGRVERPLSFVGQGCVPWLVLVRDTEEVHKALTEDTTHCSHCYIHSIEKVTGGKINAITAVTGG